MDSKLTIHLQEMAYLYSAIGRTPRPNVERKYLETPWIKIVPDGWTLMNLDKRLLRNLCAFLGCMPTELCGSTYSAKHQDRTLYYQLVIGQSYVRTTNLSILQKGELVVDFYGINEEVIIIFCYITQRKIDNELLRLVDSGDIDSYWGVVANSFFNKLVMA